MIFTPAQCARIRLCAKSIRTRERARRELTPLRHLALGGAGAAHLLMHIEVALPRGAERVQLLTDLVGQFGLPEDPSRPTGGHRALGAALVRVAELAR
jgi:hypothetical protein